MRCSILTILVLMVSEELSAQIALEKETKLTTNTSDDRYASYSPDGQKIIFESNRDGTWQIYIMNADGSEQVRLTTNESNNRRPAWHPNSETVLFESDRNGKMDLFTIDLADMEVRQLTGFQNAEPIFAQYSPDGESIAISLRESENKSNIVLLNKDGEIIKELTNTNFRSYYPRWSNDGTGIVYFSRKETENEDDEIYRLNVETGEETRLTDWPKHNFCPSWSNDDSKIVYVTSMEEIRPEIYVMDSDGKNQIRLTYNENGDTLPCWSPTGNKILITGYRDENFEIIELELDWDGE